MRSRYVIGVDEGGTKVACGLFDGNKKMLDRLQYKTDTEADGASFSDGIIKAINELLERNGLSHNNLEGVGICMPSYILFDEGYIFLTSAVQGVRNFPTRDYISERLPVNIVLDNDSNDDDYVDLLLVKAYDSYIDELAKYKNTRYGRGPIGGAYYAVTSSISANVPQGAVTCATPDGRKAGEPLAEGCSPSHSMDINGPTSVLKSVSKLRTDKITGGVLLNQKVSPQMLAKPRDRDTSCFCSERFSTCSKGFISSIMSCHARRFSARRQTPKSTGILLSASPVIPRFSTFFRVKHRTI